MDALENANANASATTRSASPSELRTEVDGVKRAKTNSPDGIRSSPPILPQPETMDIDTELPNGSTESADIGTKSDSEAETIVLPGKDGHSPSKIRKSIKHEDHSEDEEIPNAPGKGSLSVKEVSGEDVMIHAQKLLREKSSNLPGGMATANSSLGKRKRPKNGTGNVKDDPAHLGNSSGLSSVPTSPVATTRSSLSKPAASNSDLSKSPSPRSRSRDDAKSVDRVLSRRKQYASASGDEEDGEHRRFIRQRSPGADQKSTKDNRSSSKFSTDTYQDNNQRKRTRSISPHSRSHKPGTSTQLLSKSTHGGLSHKKKRVPAPLQSTEYHSEDSSASESSHPRSSRLRNLAAPTTGESTMSPAKIGPHKKHLNSSGQTLLARACLSGKLDMTKQRFEERPQDLNEADHALNTPLHVASINGFSDIVKFLLDNHCIVDPVNDQRDTPLHDAIDNGHVEVVRLLIDAGANPNKPNRHGDEPLDLVNEKEESGAYEDNEAAEIRAAIIAAKEAGREVRRLSEDEPVYDNTDSRSSHHRESTRQSPSVPGYDSYSLSSSRRVGTARSIKTSDHLLYQRLDVTALRKAAKEGDVGAAARVLEVQTNLKDTKSLLLAARGGHDEVINILFAMGGFDPDPQPVDDAPPEQATPILAAIGRDAHLKVLNLFLSQDNFDPTRRIRGQAYYEIAKKRAGPKWQEEVQLLKDAFDKYDKPHRSSSNASRSPTLRRRDGDQDVRKTTRREEQKSPRVPKRSVSTHKTNEQEAAKSQQRSASSVNQSRDGQVHTKRGPGRPRKEDISISAVISDADSTPLGLPKQKSQSKKSEPEVAVNSENENPAKPRRKLVSGKELRGERELEKQRRTSIASNASSASIKDKRGTTETKGDKIEGRVSPSVTRLPKKQNLTLKEHGLSEKQLSDKDRARSIKRDDSKDRLTAIRGESPVKRHRKSETPPRLGMQDVTVGYGTSGGPLKRRKLEGDNGTTPRTESSPTSSPDLHTPGPKNSPGLEHAEKSGSEPKPKSPYSLKKPGAPIESSSKPSVAVQPNDQTRPTKVTAHVSAFTHESSSKKKVTSDVQSESSDAELLKARLRKEAETARDQEAKREVEALRQTEAERAAEIQRQEELEAAQQKLIEEQEELERIEKAKEARLAREEAAREEEAKRQQEEAARKELQRIKDAEAAARAQEEQRKLLQEQDRLKREEQDRRREQQRAERARIEEEKRLERLSKLPLLLRWFDLCDDPKTPTVSSLFKWIDGYRYDTIRPEAAGQGNAREQWMLNTHVAILIGEKDLQLSRYTAWERIPLSQLAKRAIWRVDNGRYTLREPSFAGFGKQFPASEDLADMVDKNKSLFFDLDLFFVKVSEFMFIVPGFRHLHGIEMFVNYRELDVNFTEASPLPKWKQDPDFDPSQPFAPQPRIYLNGQFQKQQDTPMTRLSREIPSDDRRVPRRGLVPVHPADPDYEEICRKQGLSHLLVGFQTSPSSASSPEISHHNGPDQPLEHVNGITPPRSDRTKSVNGGSPNRVSVSEVDLQNSLPNGVSDSASTHEMMATISN